jgi:anti-anti-sigma regulatory factor
MADTIDLGPLRLSRDGDLATVTLSDPNAVTLEIPQDFEAETREKLSSVLDANIKLEVDLEDLPALNSRQLGLLLVLHKVCEPEARLKLRRVSSSVKRALELTRVDRFFVCE